MFAPIGLVLVRLALSSRLAPGRYCKKEEREMRRAAVLGLVLIGAGLAVPTPAGATDRQAPVTPGSRYLALGDSVTFGFEEAEVVPAPDYGNAASFLGYPLQLGSELPLRVTDAACPGETSSSLVDASAPSNGCEDAYRKQHPLHVSYKGSQLAFAVAFLRAHPNVKLVSLMVGANDIFRCQKTTSDGCLSAAEQRAVFSKISQNVRIILSAIRGRGHYGGQLAIVNYYSLDYSSAFINGVTRRLNAAMDIPARPFRVRIADGFAEFQAASLHSAGNPCTAGLLTQLGRPGKCGVHPSYAGQALLAQALAKAIVIG